MRAILFSLCSALLFLLASCGGLASTDPPTASMTPAPGVVASADQVMLEGQRAFAVAELAYRTAAEAAIGAIDAGAIKGETAAKVQRINAEARTWLMQGKAASDTAAKARAAAELFGFAGQLQSFAPQRE